MKRAVVLRWILICAAAILLLGVAVREGSAFEGQYIIFQPGQSNNVQPFQVGTTLRFCVASGINIVSGTSFTITYPDGTTSTIIPDSEVCGNLLLSQEGVHTITFTQLQGINQFVQSVKFQSYVDYAHRMTIVGLFVAIAAVLILAWATAKRREIAIAPAIALAYLGLFEIGKLQARSDIFLVFGITLSLLGALLAVIAPIQALQQRKEKQRERNDHEK